VPPSARRTASERDRPPAVHLLLKKQIKERIVTMTMARSNNPPPIFGIAFGLALSVQLWCVVAALLLKVAL